MKPAQPKKSSPAWPWIGQESFAVAALSMLERNEWPATVLLTGPAHLGKASVSQWLAQRDLCEEIPAPCGRCRNCRLVISGANSDCLVIAADGGAVKREELLEKFQRLQWRTTPTSTRRWIILTDVDQLHESIGNALLKIIEEPPEKTTVVMTSSWPERVLPTIRSRAVEFRWHRVPAQALDHYVATRFPNLPPMQRHAISRQANGRPGLAVAAAAYPDGLAEHWTSAQELLHGFATGRWPQRREWTADDLDQAEQVVRDALLLSAGVAGRIWANEAPAITAVAQQLGTARLTALAASLLQRRELLRQHVQPSFILHDLNV